MNPYSVLGIATNASKEDARKAYRKLAQKYHPDKGGNEAKFKEVKEAWELIDTGTYQATQAQPSTKSEAPYTSSFTDPAGAAKRARQAAQSQTQRPAPKDKPMKAAPGYEEKGLKLPRTMATWNPADPAEGEIQFDVSPRLAKEGVVIRFEHVKEQKYSKSNKPLVRRFEYRVKPGSTNTTVVERFLSEEDTLAGSWPPPTGTPIRIILRVREPAPEPELTPEDDETKDYEVTLNICALGLFSGGKIETKGAHGEPVSINVPPGHNPSVALTIDGHGYGKVPGKLIVKINPIFKTPSAFTENEKKMLQRLNDLVK